MNVSKNTKIINNVGLNPVITVGIPMYRCKNIGWLSLEGLCRQESMNYPWEIIIVQEKESEMLSLSKLKEYKDRLEDAGCSHFVYYEIDNWVPLGQKWHFMAQQAHEESKLFLLQGADNYPQSKRLQETYDIFLEKDCDWIKSPEGLWYDIGCNKFAYRNKTSRSGRDVAIRLELFKKMPKNKKRSGLDNFIFNCLSKYKKIKVKSNTSKSWRGGVCSSGLNNITRLRSKMINNMEGPFMPYTGKILIPKDVIKKLKNCKKYINKNKFIQK
ncbi:MAG: hypothetical protein ACOC56_02725 [Atribacterota bacterium]